MAGILDALTKLDIAPAGAVMEAAGIARSKLRDAYLEAAGEEWEMRGVAGKDYLCSSAATLGSESSRRVSVTRQTCEALCPGRGL